MKSAGIIILIAGLLVTFYTGFTSINTEKVVEVGSLEVIKKNENNFSWSPVLGIAVIVIGGGLYLYGNRKIG